MKVGAVTAGSVLGGACSGILCLLLLPTIAAAEQSIAISDVRPELHLGIGWGSELGVGGRLDIPIVAAGVIEGIDDEIALSPGAELYFRHHRDDDGVTIAAVVAGQWNFYIHHEWSLFPELGLALIAGDHGRRDDNKVRLRLLLAVGARYHWSHRNALVIRVCTPFGLQIGITF